MFAALTSKGQLTLPKDSRAVRADHPGAARHAWSPAPTPGTSGLRSPVPSAFSGPA